MAQLIYIGANWLQYKRIEYATYFFYVILLVVYFTLLGGDWIFGWIIQKNRIGGLALNLVRAIAFSGYAIYTLFIIQFLQTKTRFLKLHKPLEYLLYILIFFSIVYFLAEGIWGRSSISTFGYFSLMLVIFGFVIFMTIQLWSHPDPLGKYVLRGAVSVASGAFVSNILAIIIMATKYNYDFSWYITPLMCGIVVEFYFFNHGLVVKSQKIEQQLIDELIEKNKVQEQLLKTRIQIASDLHDDVGATLTSISLLSEAALDQKNEKQRNDTLKKIGEYARETTNNMGDIVWTINPKNESLKRISERMVNFLQNLIASSNINFYFDFSPQLSDVKSNMALSKSIFMVYKEAVNNAIKHSGCKKIFIALQIIEDKIRLEIKDDGKGLENIRNYEGNGLENMQRRAQDVGGELIIESYPDKGTAIRLDIPLEKPIAKIDTNEVS